MKSPPHDGAGQWSFQEAVTGAHVPFPGLKLRVSVRRDIAEELFGWYIPELVGHEEKRWPKLIEVAGDGTEVRRGDGPKFPVGPDGDVDYDDVVDLGDAHFQDAGCEELLPGQLINGLIEQIFDSRYNLQIERGKRAVEDLTIGIHAVRAIAPESLVLG